MTVPHLGLADSRYYVGILKQGRGQKVIACCVAGGVVTHATITKSARGKVVHALAHHPVKPADERLLAQLKACDRPTFEVVYRQIPDALRFLGDGE